MDLEWTCWKPLLEEADFEYEFLRNPGAIQSKVAPIIEDGFANERFILKTTNQCSGIPIIPLSKKTKTGTRDFEKEPLRRKTDGFHAFIAALYKREIIKESTVGDFLDVIEDWEF